MAYVPITRGEIKKLGKMKEVGLFRAFAKRQDWMLVLPGETGVIVFVTGESVGSAAPWDAITDEMGLSITGLVIEGDDESRFDTNEFHLPRAGLIRTADGWSVASRMMDSSAGRGCVVDFEGAEKEHYRNAIGYLNWRISIKEHGDLVTLIDVRAGEKIGML